MGELLKLFAIALTVALSLSLLLFFGGLLFGTENAASGLEAAKNGMFLITALGLFLLAGTILSSGKKKSSKSFEGFRTHFPTAGRRTAAFAVCAAFLAASCILDYIQICLYG